MSPPHVSLPGSEDWDRLAEVFHAACALPPHKRRQFIVEATADAPARRAELLAMVDGVDDELEVERCLRALAPADLESGAVVDRYRVQRRIGCGGMGDVYLAERTGAGAPERVALKLLRRAMVGAESAARFDRERRILARLSHPNIVALLDGGVTQDGRPYLVLEYVDGVPMTQAADAQRLDRSARLRLFVSACRALEYAHAQGVVHRDVKPSNILVTPAGDVRLLDFGIARMIDAAQTVEQGLTRAAVGPMTPERAAPEQRDGHPPTPATDVWALGILLHELLTGTLPQPGRRLRLGGDLDRILRRSLAPDPQARYASAGAFADAVAACVERGRSDGPSTRMRRIAAAAAVLAVATSGGWLAWEGRAASQARARAAYARGFMASLVEDARRPVRGESRLQAARRASEAALALDVPADLKLEVLNLVARGLLGHGDTATAQRVVGAALEQGTRELGTGHPQTMRARLNAAWLDLHRGELGEMRAGLDRVMAVMMDDQAAYRRDLVVGWRLRANLAVASGDGAGAVASAIEAVRRAEQVVGPEDAAYQAALVVLGESYRIARQPAMALDTARRALALAERVHAGDPLHPSVIRARALHARALRDAGHLLQAIDESQRVADLAARSLGPDARPVGRVLRHASQSQLQAGRIDDAVRTGARAAAIAGEHAEPGTAAQAAALAVLGDALLAARRGEPALAPTLAARDAAVRLNGATHPTALEARTNHARALLFAGRIDAAAEEIAEVLADTRASGMTLARPLHVAGMIRRLAGDLEAAAALQAAAAAAGDVASEPGLREEIDTERGLTLLERNPDEAVAVLREARRRFELTNASMTPVHADVLMGLGRLELRRGAAAAARPLLAAAARFWAEFEGTSRWSGEAAFYLAEAELAGGQAPARATLARAAAILSRSPFPSDSALARAARARLGAER